MNIFLTDILSQPAALRKMLQGSDLHGLEPLRVALQTGHFKNIIFTGMGASWSGLYPAWLQLASEGFPAIWLDSAELLHHAPALINRDSLIWIASQSGRSAEIVGLLDIVDQVRPGGLIAITNDPDSPLGQCAAHSGGILLQLLADPEVSVSTRTYLNTLALGQMAARTLTGVIPIARTLLAVQADLQCTADSLESYLADYQDHLTALSVIFRDKPFPPKLVFLGRGPSLASVFTGALNVQEAAKLPTMGMQSAEFRHGPLEIADQDLNVLIFLGSPKSKAAALNRRLWVDLQNIGASAWLIGHGELASNEDDLQGLFRLPTVPETGLTLMEMLPVQLLCSYLADRQGLEPGSFRHIGKVTNRE